MNAWCIEGRLSDGMILRVAGTKREMLYRDAPMGHSQNEIDRVTGRRGNVFWVISEFPVSSDGYIIRRCVRRRREDRSN